MTSSERWSKTLNLPNTGFPMKAGLASREPSIIEFWQKKQIYGKLLQKRKNSKKRFILHDGPPYANGHFHVGHALNKILKDTINKFQLLQGAYVNYVPGWDCHGLPIELAVIKKLANKKNNSHKDPKIIREACREYALKYMNLQAEDQTRMGVFWQDSEKRIRSETVENNAKNSHIYFTMSRNFEASILETFKELFIQGLIYKGRKPIHWCPSCATALAEAEVEYKPHVSYSIYVTFPVKNLKDTSIVVWTTTPWTLPANLGVCFHPDFEYASYRVNGTFTGDLIIASSLEEEFFKKTGLEKISRNKISRQEIQKLEIKHPFLDQESHVLFGEHVTLEMGTGIVHTAPGHGYDDYLIGKKYGLEVYSPVDHRGRFTEEFPQMAGVKIFEANTSIIKMLKQENTLINEDKLEHSYPYCWRCHGPLIFRATPQWFLSVEGLKALAFKEIQGVQWIPAWGEARFKSTIEKRPDWCLSRQRYWGVPIPSFSCIQCNKTYLNEESLKRVIDKVKEQGIEIWFEENAARLLPENAKCECGSEEFQKETDILDVWFDSGVTWNAVLKQNPSLVFPADLYLEGSDQHRGWFQSSLWPALAIEKKAPYLRVLTHGYVLDEKGRAMSKSLGNVISPVQDIIPKYGGDVLRLWVASEDFRSDNTIGFGILDQLSDSYRKIRNTFRYMLGNLQDGKLFPYLDESAITNELDRWILHCLAVLGDQMKKAYEAYELHTAYQRALKFCSVELSQLYFDIIRDSLYCDDNPIGANSISSSRKSSLAALKTILGCLNVWLAPILSFTMEEVYQTLEHKEHESIFQEAWPDCSHWLNQKISEKFDAIWQLKDRVNIELENARTIKKIGSPIDACVSLPKDQTSDIFSTESITKYLVVSEVAFTDSKEISVEPSSKAKCPRCWLRRDLTDKHICKRCSGKVGGQDG